ncbi:MAG: hypothetical protein PHW08_14140 [Kiritimatiellae bacterium]|nr:hypothetical protein [Kiritimatiellia bacterium]
MSARTTDNECRRGRDFPTAWRSSFINRQIPPVQQGAWGSTDAAILLGKHIVPSRTVAVVRRITAKPFKYDRQQGLIVWDASPGWWFPSGMGVFGMWWNWQWNLARAPLDPRTRVIQPGFLLQAPPGRIRDVLGHQVFEFAENGWQSLTDDGTLTMSGTDTRYIVEGPQVVMLWAIVTVENRQQGKLPDIPFASSFGSLEGIDVPIDAWKASPSQWLIP